MSKITINEIINNTREQRVFVRNATKAADRAQIIITVRTASGRTDTATVPPTWIPIDLTLQTTKKDLMDSSEFRRALANNLVDLVDATEADSILATADGQRELNRVRAMQDLSADVVQLNRSANIDGAVDPAVQEVADALAGRTGEKSRVFILVDDLLARLESNEINEPDALSELRSLGIDNETAVMRHIKDAAKVDRRWNLIFKWARQHLSNHE